MRQHKWHKEIKAWADGAEIECKNKTFYGADWEDVKDPMWLDDNEYRIKPQPNGQQGCCCQQKDAHSPQYLYLYWGNRNNQGYDYFVSPKVLPCYQLVNKIKMECGW